MVGATRETFIDQILPVEQIYWFRDAQNSSLIEHAQLYINEMKDIPFDPEQHEVDYSHFMDTLVIVTPSDEEGLYLLNPRVQNKAGEWQAWLIWALGSRRRWLCVVSGID